MPTGTIGAPVRRARIVEAVLGLLEHARRAPRALRKDHQDVTLVEDPLGQPERLDVGGAALDADHAALAEDQPITGHSSASCLPSQ